MPVPFLPGPRTISVTQRSKHFVPGRSSDPQSVKHEGSVARTTSKRRFATQDAFTNCAGANCRQVHPLLSPGCVSLAHCPRLGVLYQSPPKYEVSYASVKEQTHAHAHGCVGAAKTCHRRHVSSFQYFLFSRVRTRLFNHLERKVPLVPSGVSTHTNVGSVTVPTSSRVVPFRVHDDKSLLRRPATKTQCQHHSLRQVAQFDLRPKTSTWVAVSTLPVRHVEELLLPREVVRITFEIWSEFRVKLNLKFTKQWMVIQETLVRVVRWLTI